MEIPMCLSSTDIESWGCLIAASEPSGSVLSVRPGQIGTTFSVRRRQMTVSRSAAKAIGKWFCVISPLTENLLKLPTEEHRNVLTLL